jgi:hypothetical protein
VPLATHPTGDDIDGLSRKRLKRWPWCLLREETPDFMNHLFGEILVLLEDLDRDTS